jgi:peptidoglycan hydrolase-like protein with peptidoglycan-binding domain
MKKLFTSLLLLTSVFILNFSFIGNVHAQVVVSNICQFPQDLTIGSVGTDVVNLQTFLETKGYLVMSTNDPKGYFGNSTKTALAKYQVAVGISPADGYFGVVSRVKMNADCTGTSSQEKKVDLKVNGSSNPKEIEYGSTFTLSWNAQGLTGGDCAFSGHYIPVVGGGLLTDHINEKTSGSIKLEARHANYGFINPLETTIQCSDNLGNTVKNTIKIPVKEVQDSTIKTLSPNGGEKYKIGDTITIKWKSLGDIATKNNIQIGLLDTRYSSEAGPRREATVAYSIANTGTYSWKVPEFVGDMDLKDTNQSVYKIIIHSWGQTNSGAAIADSSDKTFIITNPLATSTPYIKVLSPNGGEKYTEGQDVKIQWESNLPETQKLNLILWLGDKSIGKEITTVTNKDKSYTWKAENVKSIVSTESTPPTTFYSNGLFQMGLYCPIEYKICMKKDGSQSNYADRSDKSFSVVSKASSTPPIVKSGSVSADYVSATKTDGSYNVSFTVTAPSDDDIYIPTSASRTATTTAGAGFTVYDSSNAYVATATTSLAEITKTSGSATLTGSYYKILMGSTATFDMHVIIDNFGGTLNVARKVGLTQINYSVGSATTPTASYTAGLDESYRTASILLYSKKQNNLVSNFNANSLSSSTNVFLSSPDLELGMTNPAVQALQKYLNTNGYMVNEVAGQPGSIGYESDYFGEKTKQALIKFQTAKGITPAKGYFGPKTRGAMGI